MAQIFDWCVSVLGEYTGDYNELVYLRARYYAPGTGRFLTRDAWGGTAGMPMTFNKWGYANANPVLYTDRSGLRPECWNQVSAVAGQICAIERFHEILQEHSNNGVNALAALFTDSELQNMGGFYAGTTSETRLEWILRATLGSNKSLGLHIGSVVSCSLPWQWEARALGIADQLPPLAYHFQFAISFPTESNSGLPKELEDSQFYNGKIWIKQISYQINHFLSAVSEYYYGGRDLRLIISHEKSKDPVGQLTRGDLEVLYTNVTNEVTTADRSHFYRAWHYDTNGMYTERDTELWAILGFGPNVAFSDVDKERQGNSLQDLRLSLRGVRFADWVMSHRSNSPSEAGQWLTANLPLP